MSPTTFEVVERPTKLDTESWDYVSQHGTDDQVLALLNRENVHALDLEKIAFRLRDLYAAAKLPIPDELGLYKSYDLWVVPHRVAIIRRKGNAEVAAVGVEVE